MKRVLLCLSFLLVGSQVPLAAQTKNDLTFQQSPAKPKPAWFKSVDQGKFDPRLKGYFTPEGIKLEIVAEAPTVINPVGMTFGPDGTLYVLEWVAPSNPKEVAAENYPIISYKDGTKRQTAIMKKPTKDWVKVLRDTQGKGIFDEAKVILEDEIPSSILVHDGWLYLSGQGTVRRYRLDSLGTKDVKKETIALGFCGFHHHQVSGLTIGNDGWLYITSGDDDNIVEGSDGSRATVLRTGAVFRCKPDGSRMQVHSLGFRNPYRDVAFDASFNMFHVDNDNEDGSKFTGCRLMHVPEGADFGWRLRVGSRCCVPDATRAAVYGELPGKVAPMLKTGRGSPAGLFISNDSYFPDEYRGLLFYPDVFRRLIRAYKVAPQGASFEVVEEFEFLRSDDPLFRPCQMVQGPDGAIYICDWRTDSGGAGKLWGDGKHGRIYRVSWAGTAEQPAIPLRNADSWAKIARAEDEDLLKSLASPNFSDRQIAQHEVIRRGTKLHPGLEKIAKDTEQTLPPRIAALGALVAQECDLGWKTCRDLAENGPLDLCRLAIDGLALQKGDKPYLPPLSLTQADPALRRAAFLAMGRLNRDGTAEVLVNALKFDNGKDTMLRDGLIRAIELTGRDGIDQLLALTDTGNDGDLDLLLSVYSGLRSPEAAAGIPGLLRKYHLTPTNKVDLIRSYHNYQFVPPLNLDPLVEYLHEIVQKSRDPKGVDKAKTMVPVMLAALEVLSANGALKADVFREQMMNLLSDRDPLVRMAIVKTIEETRMTTAGPLLVELLAKAADLDERLALVGTLGKLKEKTAASNLEMILADAGLDAGLRLAALRAFVALDGNKARLRAEVLLKDESVAIQQEAVMVLVEQKASAQKVGQAYLDRTLPRSLFPQVTDGLRRFAKDDKECSRLLYEILKGGLNVATDPQGLERLQKLLQAKANPERGKALYLNNKALGCVTCHKLEGIGGSVGPDLTKVHETTSLEKVIESMLDPSKEIKEGYQAYTAVTKDGKVHLGLKVSQNADALALKDSTGKEVRIPTSELEELAVSKKSLMPDDVVRHLSFDEFLDLVAFLRSRTAQESMRATTPRKE